MQKQRHSSFIFSSKEWRVFFFKTLLVALFVFLIGFVWLPLLDFESYNGSIIDKTERLKTVQGPKIVLIGDSNVAYGMRSDLLEQAFGMPVVNMGYNALMGTVFNENLAKRNVVPGDIYIIAYALYSDDKADFQKMADVLSALRVSQDARSIIFEPPWDENDWELLGRIAKGYPAYLRSHAQALAIKTVKEIDKRLHLHLPQNAENIARSSFNEYGDIAPGLKLTTVMKDDTEFQDYEVQVPGPETIERWNELNKWYSARGATLLLAGYPIPYGKYTPPIEEFEAARKEIKTKVDIPLISNFRDYMFAYELFYNSSLHLNDEGARLRTEQLIKDLRGWMEQTGYRIA